MVRTCVSSTPYRFYHQQGGIILKWLKVDPDKCVGCGTCMETCSTTWFKENNPALSRIQVTKKDEDNYDLNACNQCGTCIDMCPVGALARDGNGIVRMDEKKCVGCLMCVGFCPTKSFFYHAAKRSEPFKCIACGLCVKKCPVEALTIVTE